MRLVALNQNMSSLEFEHLVFVSKSHERCATFRAGNARLCTKTNSQLFVEAGYRPGCLFFVIYMKN